MSNKYESVNIESPKITSLANVLGDNTIYNIPPFQRNYSWEEKNCKELYEDIVNNCKKNKAYFIGMFMYYNEGPYTGNEHSNVLIDGQQRLTTIMLLLCAIRDITNDSKLKDDINTFITNSNADLNKFKLKQNNNDDVYFNNILIEKNVDNKSLIYKNYSKFKEWLLELKKVNLNELFEHIKKLESIEIVLKNDNINNVQEIFEKINSTGIKLSDAELIRNFVLFTSNAEEQQELYNMWVCMEKIVGLNKITKFVRAYTIRNTYNVVDNDKVYIEFREKFRNTNKKTILKDMLKYSIYYSIIKNHFYWEYDENYDSKEIKKDNRYIDNTLRLLNALGTDDVIPMMMQLYSKLYDNNEKLLGQLLELILEFMIRYRVVKPSGGGGSLNNRLYRIMKKIEEKKCKLTFNGLYEELSTFEAETTNFPTNDKFIYNMRNDMDSEKGRVLLFQYARRKKMEISTSYVFNKDVSLEHLMPQTIKDDTPEGKWWIKNFGKDEIQRIRNSYTDCIGNYGLLSRSLNTEASNNKWPIKREIILKDAIDEETINAAKSEIWKEEDIIKRNDELSNQIAQYITGPKNENKKSFQWLDKKYDQKYKTKKNKK